ncbi:MULTISPECIES: hypothetical protein [Aphanothece]|uniref:hypothetical protein n=1 Tax=Aphanothece TaxID=1121 RepID=UPI0039855BE7
MAQRTTRTAAEQFRIDAREKPHFPELLHWHAATTSWLRQGQGVALGCCGSADCHGHWSAGHLKSVTTHDHSITISPVS